MKTPKASEKQIQNSILDYLKILERKGELYACRTQAAAVAVARRDGSTGFMKTGRRGTPDITICFRGGLWIGIEVKTPETIKNLSPAQKSTKDFIDQINGRYWVVASVEEVERRLRMLKQEVLNYSKELYEYLFDTKKPNNS